jgi:hypothetical protein
MARKKWSRPYGEVAVRAMGDALYQRLIDCCWEELKRVFEDPEIRAAEAKIMRAIADAFAPNGRNGKHRRRRR